MESFEITLTKLCSGQEMLFKNQSKENNYKKTEQGRVTVVLHNPSSYCKKHAYQVLKSFEHMVTMLRPRQEMLYKNQRGLIQKRIKMKLPFLSTALKVIARNMHTKFGAI